MDEQECDWAPTPVDLQEHLHEMHGGPPASAYSIDDKESANHRSRFHHQLHVRRIPQIIDHEHTHVIDEEPLP